MVGVSLKFFFLLSYIIGTSATLKFFFDGASGGNFFYIIGEAKVGVRPQGFIRGFAVGLEPARERELFLYYRQTNKGGQTSGIYVRICLAAGAFNYINRCLKAGVQGQGFRWCERRLLLHCLSRRDRTK